MQSDSSSVEKISIWHPSAAFFRYTLLVFTCLLTFGSYFAYDSVGALANSLIKELHLTQSESNSLYSAYSIAAIFIVLFGGILTDKLGTRRASLLFSALVTIGALMVAIADSKFMLFFGRFVFGAGSESLVVAQLAILSKWFTGRELALSFGVSLTISRLGTLFSFNTEALIADFFQNYRYALWAAFILCAFSLACNFIVNILDTRGERILGRKDGNSGEKIVFSDIRSFNSSFWYVTLLCVTFYSAIFPFTGLAVNFFTEKWGIPDIQATSGTFLYKVLFNYLHMFAGLS